MQSPPSFPPACLPPRPGRQGLPHRAAGLPVHHLAALAHEDGIDRMSIAVKYQPCDTNLLGVLPGEI